MIPYPNWRMKYSNEDFDRAQALARELTKADGTAKQGYSDANFDKAKTAVRKAQL